MNARQRRVQRRAMNRRLSESEGHQTAENRRRMAAADRYYGHIRRGGWTDSRKGRRVRYAFMWEAF